jgi:hypothetical protein
LKTCNNQIKIIDIDFESKDDDIKLELKLQLEYNGEYLLNILKNNKLELNKIFDTQDIIKKNDFNKILIYLDNPQQKLNLGKYFYLLVGMKNYIEKIMIKNDGISFFKWLFKNEKLPNWTCDTFLPINLRL